MKLRIIEEALGNLMGRLWSRVRYFKEIYSIRRSKEKNQYLRWRMKEISRRKLKEISRRKLRRMGNRMRKRL